MPDAARDDSAIHTPLKPMDLGIGQLFERIRDAVVVADPNGRIVLWNPAACSIFGWTEDEALGANVEILVPERMRAGHYAGMQRYRRDGHAPLMDAGAILELPAVRKDGSEITVEMTLSPLAIRDRYSLAIIRDVTERTRLRAQLEQEGQRLREANESLEAFSYVVSHDLKEPVRAVDVYLEAAGESLGTPDAAEAIRHAKKANERLRVLLTGLLEWSRASMGALELEPLDPRAVAQSPSCQLQYQQLVLDRGARVEWRGEIPRVLGTEGLLCQVFGNVIANAIRHNPGDAPRVVIEPAAAQHAGLVEVVVRDNGPGFPEEVLKRFGTLRALRPSTVKGGFGLAITRRAVARLGGRVWLVNGPEGGEVHMTLPVAR